MNPKTHGAARGLIPNYANEFFPNYVGGAIRVAASTAQRISPAISRASTKLSSALGALTKNTKATGTSMGVLAKNTAKNNKKAKPGIVRRAKDAVARNPVTKGVKKAGGLIGKGFSGAQSLYFGMFGITEVLGPALKSLGVIDKDAEGIGGMFESLKKSFGMIDEASYDRAAYLAGLDEEIKLLQQAAERTDKFGATISKLGTAIDSRNVSAIGQSLTEVLTQIEDVDITDMQKSDLFGSLAKRDMEGFSDLIKEIQRVSQAKISFKSFQSNLVSSIEKAVENVGEEDIFSEGGLTQEDIKSFSSSVSKIIPEGELENFAKEAERVVKSGGGASKFLTEQLKKYDKIDSKFAKTIQDQEGVAEQILKGASAAARYKMVVAQLESQMEISSKANKNLASSLSSLSTAISNSSDVARSAFKHFSKLRDINFDTNISNLKSGGTVIESDLIRAAASSDIKQSRATGSFETQNILQDFAKKVIDSTPSSEDGSVTTISKDLEKLIQSMESGSVDQSAAIEVLGKHLETGTDDQKKIAQETHKALITNASAQVSAQAEIRANMEKQLRALENQTAEFRRSTIFSKGQLDGLRGLSKSFNLSTYAQKTQSEKLSEMQSALKLLGKDGLGFDEKIIATLAESNKQSIELEGLNNVLSSLSGIKFEAKSLEELDRLLKDFIESNAFDQLDQKVRGLLTGAPKAIERALENREFGGVKKEADLEKGIISDKQISKLSSDFAKSISQELKAQLDIKGELLN